MMVRRSGATGRTVNNDPTSPSTAWTLSFSTCIFRWTSCTRTLPIAARRGLSVDMLIWRLVEERVEVDNIVGIG